MGEIFYVNGYNIGVILEIFVFVDVNCFFGGIFSGFGVDVWYEFYFIEFMCVEICVSGF